MAFSIKIAASSCQKVRQTVKERKYNLRSPQNCIIVNVKINKMIVVTTFCSAATRTIACQKRYVDQLALASSMWRESLQKSSARGAEGEV